MCRFTANLIIKLGILVIKGVSIVPNNSSGAILLQRGEDGGLHRLLESFLNPIISAGTLFLFQLFQSGLGNGQVSVRGKTCLVLIVPE